jgi:hypothetical protein
MNWEDVGVVPDVEVPAGDAFAIAYRRALEHVSGLEAEPPAAAEARQALDELTAGNPCVRSTNRPS